MSLLAVEDVSIAFGGVAALDGVSLAVPQAEIRGIIGPNGAGKTTLLNVICGMSRPDRGAVRLAGESLVGLKPSQIAARGLGRTFQTSQQNAQNDEHPATQASSFESLPSSHSSAPTCAPSPQSPLSVRMHSEVQPSSSSKQTARLSALLRCTSARMRPTHTLSRIPTAISRACSSPHRGGERGWAHRSSRQHRTGRPHRARLRCA